MCTRVQGLRLLLPSREAVGPMLPPSERRGQRSQGHRKPWL